MWDVHIPSGVWPTPNVFQDSASSDEGQTYTQKYYTSFNKVEIQTFPDEEKLKDVTTIIPALQNAKGKSSWNKNDTR